MNKFKPLLGSKENPLIITRENCHFYPEYKRRVFDKYPNVVEIKWWGQYCYGYFGNDYGFFTEVNGKRVVTRKFTDFVHRNVEWKEITNFLENLKLTNKE